MGLKDLRVAIVGGGMGGLATAATLSRIGVRATIYEHARRFTRIGAGIQMMPNSMKVLRAIGVEDRLRSTSFEPYSRLSGRERGSAGADTAPGRNCSRAPSAWTRSPAPSARGA